MTPGFKSTEFWHSMASGGAGLGLCAFGLERANDVLAVAGAALLGLSCFAYAHSRGRAKAPRPYLPPQGKI